jgi:hypothetical protein
MNLDLLSILDCMCSAWVHNHAIASHHGLSVGLIGRGASVLVPREQVAQVDASSVAV